MDKSVLWNSFKRIIILVFVFICILYSDQEIQDDVFKNGKTLFFIMMISILFTFKGTIAKLGNTPMLLVYGLYIITIYGYTFYQWEVSGKKTDSDCGLTIPRTKNFSKSQYYLYRIMYLTTIIVIVVLIQNLLDKGNNIKTGLFNPQNFVVFLPFLLPLLTEIVNGIVSISSSEDYSINPESLS